LVLFLCLLLNGSRAIAQDTVNESDKARILKRLDELSETSKKARVGRYSSALTAFQAAAASPAKSYDFYLECYKLVHFDRHGKKFSEYRDWKAANIQKIRDTSHSTMLQFQLSYLAMTIKALNMEDRTKIIPDLQKFIDAVVAKEDFMGDHARKLRQGVESTVFARAYSLDSALSKSEGWETAPLNVTGHYFKTILPALREKEDTAGLSSAWDKYIKLETHLVSTKEDVKAKDDFVEKRLPSMKWAKWTDIADNGDRAKAASAMLALIEKNMKHESVDSWISDLKDVVEGKRITVDSEDE